MDYKTNSERLKGVRVKLYTPNAAETLPSIDPFSSQLLYLIRIHDLKNLKVIVKHFSGSIDLPKLEINGTSYRDQNVIKREFAYLTSANNMDMFLNKKDAIRMRVVRENLGVNIERIALLHMWGCKENREQSIKYWTQNTHFPWNVFLSRNLRRCMDTKKINQQNTFDETFKELSHHLVDLSAMLETRTYLFGEKPSTLDVYVCSFLGPILMLNYPNSHIKDLVLRGGTNLEEYVKNFVEKYGCERKLNVEDADRASWPMILGAGVFAASAMVLYAFANDLIPVPFLKINFLRI